MTLTEFLLVRIAEDAAYAAAHHMRSCMEYVGGSQCSCYYPDRVVAECEAKRRIVEEHVPSASHRWCFVCTVDVPQPNDPAPYPCNTLRALAMPYADHPDYRDEWRP